MAKQKDQQYPNSIYKAKDDKIVLPGNPKPIARIARFLKPCAKSTNQAMKVTNAPLLWELFLHNIGHEWPPQVIFKGWKNTSPRWEEWVENQARQNSHIWKQAGIFDAILSSKYEVRRNTDLVLGLAEFWCLETNTFLFPWGEATITLEDVMVLGGFPVLGFPVTQPITGDLMKFKEEMEKQRREVSKSRAKKPTESGWMNLFMEKKGVYEHVAFLSFWLSRYVFPSLPESTIGTHVFSIAVHLSQGTRIELAPAVLAGIYKNLRLLREGALSSSDSITVLGLFKLVQLWAFERFPILSRPKLPNPLNLGEPRVARWHKLDSKISLPHVKSVLKLVENFQWRPYAVDVKNWKHLSYYRGNEQMVFDFSDLDEDIMSFVRCLCSCELQGLDCVEKYMPHRVALQFGMDQDIPGDFSCVDFNWDNFGCIYVPSRLYEAGVSIRYFNWWKESIMDRQDAIFQIMEQDRSSKKKNLQESNGTPKAPTFVKQESDYNSSATFRPKFASLFKESISTPVLKTNPIERKTLAHHISNPFEPKNSNGEYNHCSQKLPKVSTACKSEDRHVLNIPPESHSKIILQDFNDGDDADDDDNVMLSERLALLRNSARGTDQNGRKRKFSTTMNSSRRTIANGAADRKWERKDNVLAGYDPNGAAKQGKRVIGRDQAFPSKKDQIWQMI